MDYNDQLNIAIRLNKISSVKFSIVKKIDGKVDDNNLIKSKYLEMAKY